MSELYAIAMANGRKFKIQIPSSPAPKTKAAVFVGDDKQAELLGYVCALYEARDARGTSLGYYASTFDAVHAVAKLLEWKPAI
jgi:hypothetical protein